MQEEQKVIEAKIRMRQQELQDDEERQKRREEDIRLGRIRLPTPQAQPNNIHPTSIAPVDETEGFNLFSAWGNTNRQPQVKSLIICKMSGEQLFHLEISLDKLSILPGFSLYRLKVIKCASVLLGKHLWY